MTAETEEKGHSDSFVLACILILLVPSQSVLVHDFTLVPSSVSAPAWSFLWGLYVVGLGTDLVIDDPARSMTRFKVQKWAFPTTIGNNIPMRWSIEPIPLRVSTSEYRPRHVYRCIKSGFPEYLIPR